jgi:hypothetical protein
MVTYAEEDFIPGVTPTQSDLLYSGQIQAVIDGTAVPWYEVTWGPDVDPVDVFTSEMDGAPQVDSADPGALQVGLSDQVAPWGIYFSDPLALPAGTITELRLTGDADAAVSLEPQS